MRLLIDATCIVNKPTGAGRYAVQLLTALSRMDRDNEYTIFVQRSLNSDCPVFALSRAANFHFRRINSPAVGPAKQLAFAWVLGQVHNCRSLIHSLNSELPLFHSMNGVVTVHDLKYLKYPHYLQGLAWLKARYLKYIIGRSVGKARKVITDSESTKKDLMTDLRVPEEKVRVVHLASALHETPAPDEKLHAGILAKYNVRVPFFLFVGEKRRHKNLEGLIEAFAMFKRQGDTWGTTLVAIGPPHSSGSDYLAMTQRLAVDRFITFIDFVDDEHLGVIYRHAEALVMPSLYEGFGLPILEAMEHETAVITSNLSSMPEVAGDAALLVNPLDPSDIAEKMRMLMCSPSLGAALVAKGRERVRSFSWDKVASETLRVYQECFH